MLVRNRALHLLRLLRGLLIDTFKVRTTAPHGLSRGFFASVGFITLFFLGYLSFQLWAAYRHLETTQKTQLMFYEQAGTIKYLDEVLTMSARMSAATGDPEWEARYRRFEPELDHAIKQVMEMAREPHMAKVISDTDAANASLVAMENRAFACVHEDHRVLAASILSSAEYQTEKKRYWEGVEGIFRSCASTLQEVADARKRTNFMAILTILILGPVLVGTWLRIAWLIRRHVKELKGLIPICANCKKIRNDEGFWQQVESYISVRSDATFSHGICPDCADVLYPEVAQRRREKAAKAATS